jgi:hypothetical protein
MRSVWCSSSAVSASRSCAPARRRPRWAHRRAGVRAADVVLTLIAAALLLGTLVYGVLRLYA